MGIVIRQSIKGTIVNYIGTFIGLITVFFVSAKYLTDTEIGLVRVLIDTATLLAGLSQLGSSSSIIRFFPFFKNDKNEDNGFFFWTLVVPFIGFLIFGLLYIFFKESISDEFVEKSPLFIDYYYFILPLAFSILYQAIFETNASVLMRVVIPKFVREVVTRSLLLAVYLLYAFHVINLDGFVMAFCSVYAIATIYNLVYLFTIKHISFKPNFKYITKDLAKEYLFYASFLTIATLVGAITPFISTLFITAQMGLAFTGVYSMANHMAALIEIPSRSLNAITAPQISSEMKNNNIKEVNLLCKQVSLLQFIAGCFIFFAIWTNIDLIFEIIPNGDIYIAGKWVVLIISLSKLYNSTIAIGLSVISYSKYYSYSLFFTFILTVTAITLNNNLISLWGINGAALSTLFSYLLYSILLLLFIAVRIKVSPFSWKQLKTVLIISALFMLNWIWTNFFTPIFLQIPISDLFVKIVDAVIRTLVLVSGGVFILYHWKISEQTNMVIYKLLSKLK